MDILVSVLVLDEKLLAFHHLVILAVGLWWMIFTNPFSQWVLVEINRIRSSSSKEWWYVYVQYTEVAQRMEGQIILKKEELPGESPQNEWHLSWVLRERHEGTSNEKRTAMKRNSTPSNRHLFCPYYVAGTELFAGFKTVNETKPVTKVSNKLQRQAVWEGIKDWNLLKHLDHTFSHVKYESQ